MARELKTMAGGEGCDLVTGTDTFTARIGKIIAIVSNADGSRLLNVKHKNSLDEEITVTSLSYLGAVDINDGKFIKPDQPLTKITPSAGSFWVYYDASL